MKNILIGIVLSLTISGQAYSEECKPCKIATSLSELVSKELPKSIDKEVTIVGVSAEKNILTFKVIYAYTRQDLQRFLQKHGGSMQEIKSYTRLSARKLCDNEKTRMFVDMGGIYVYSYYFVDDEHFVDAKLSGCPKST